MLTQKVERDIWAMKNWSVKTWAMGNLDNGET